MAICSGFAIPSKRILMSHKEVAKSTRFATWGYGAAGTGLASGDLSFADGFINRQTDWTRKSNCRVSSRLCLPHQRIGADWVQIQTEALRVLSCALEARCPWTMVSVFPFSGNDSLDPPHRELNSIRKLIAGVLRPIPMNDENLIS